MNTRYTWSESIGMCCSENSDGLAAIRIPAYYNLNRSLTNSDSPHNLTINGIWELPGTSLNAPGSAQRADQIKSEVATLGGAGRGQSYFDPLAYRAVTHARFGTAGFNSLRGPGIFNLDMGLFREFDERVCRFGLRLSW